MPQGASAIVSEALLRLVVLGAPRVGKSTTVIATAPGPAYVLACDASVSDLQGAARLRQDFEFDLVTSWAELGKCMKHAAEGAKAGKYKTVVLDTLSGLAQTLEAEELAAAGDDGRRAYAKYGMKLRFLIRQLFKLPCHVVITSHYIELGDGIDGKPKAGIGRLPLLAGSARTTVAALCPDVVFLEKKKDDSRVFQINPTGVWGVGTKSFTGQNLELDANIESLIQHQRGKQ